jgi:hypothetical protein
MAAALSVRALQLSGVGSRFVAAWLLHVLYAPHAAFGVALGGFMEGGRTPAYFTGWICPCGWTAVLFADGGEHYYAHTAALRFRVQTQRARPYSLPFASMVVPVKLPDFCRSVPLA